MCKSVFEHIVFVHANIKIGVSRAIRPLEAVPPTSLFLSMENKLTSKTLGIPEFIMSLV